MKPKLRVSTGKKKAPAKKSSTQKLYNATAQKKVAASAKRNAIVMSGKTTRTMGHTLASGQRKQARRDSKN